MDASTREVVRRRAREQCEYCRMPEEATPFISFHVEHIIARQHQVDDSLDNLALSCDRCNAFKGPNLSSVVPSTGQIVTLFNPRLDDWYAHFRLEGGTIIGESSNGQATVHLLQMNSPRRVELRELWLESGGEL